jgi:hypothetical protein
MTQAESAADFVVAPVENCRVRKLHEDALGWLDGKRILKPRHLCPADD